MIARPRLTLSFVLAWAAFTLIGLFCGRTLYGQNRSSSAPRTRAEIERKSREIKKNVADHQRQVREHLNLPATGGRAPGAPLTRPNSSSLPRAESLRKDFKMPDPRSLGKSTGSGMKKNSVEYSARRGQEIAFSVEMLARDGGLQKQWTGKPYFAGVFSDVRRSFSEMFCIGNLACSIRSSADRPWSAAPLDDIDLPQSFMFGSSGVMNTQTTGMFDQPTLPLQMSAILSPEELIFPALPTFSDSSRGESKVPSTFYLRGGQKNILGIAPTTTLNGEFRRVSRIENESSSRPKIINERGFQCPSKAVGLSFRQEGTIDAREGMIVNSEIDYRLQLDGDVRVVVKVNRLYGDDLAQARDAALKKLPHSRWPEYFRRVPVEGDTFGMHLPYTTADVPVGQQVAVAIDINERSAHGSRDYLARTIDGAPKGKVRIRLDGSNEQMDVSPSDLRLPK